MDAEERYYRAVFLGERIGPEKVMISSTDSCNLFCKTCWRLEKEENPNRWSDHELTLDEIECILRDCRELGVGSIDFTGGGEPFLRKDVFEILARVKDHGFWATLTTNGTLLDRERIEAVIRGGLDDICFSIESTDAGVNDFIRGAGVCDKVMTSLRTLQKAKRELGSDTPVVRLATVVTRHNYDRLDGLAALAKETGVAAINFSVLLEWSTNRDLSMKGLDQGTVMEALDRIRQALDGIGIYSNLASVRRHGLFEHDLPALCFAPWEMLFINARGDALACCILASFYENLLGNIRDTPLTELWFGGKMEAFRARIREGDYYPGCRRCLPEFVDIFNDRLAGIKRRHAEVRAGRAAGLRGEE
ncbi:radical SAM/SPASM domain-containing protein [Thermodesulfobacteriota bacterium]